MRFRSHLGRPLDLGNRWNLAIAVLSVLAGVAGLVFGTAGDEGSWFPVRAAGATFLAWALGRELDPDRQVSAMVAGLGGMGWALAGLPTALLPMAALLLAARLVAETTGRRPLASDLGAMVVLAAVTSFTRVGWVAGFGLAVAVYLDTRLTEKPQRTGIYAAVGAATAASLVATLTGAFPQDLPRVDPLLVVAMGTLALVTIAREPAAPISFVDSRDRRFLRQDRLHLARILVGITLFVAALLAGEEALSTGPVALALLVAAFGSEVDRMARAGRPA